jgi:alcohol dehydrogenase class IV
MSFSFVLPQKVIFGKGSIELTGEEAKRLGGRTVLIVTSPGMVHRPHLKQAADSLKKHKLRYDVFSEVTPEPPIEDVYRCVAFARKKVTDLLVGLGGGSVMDVAKKAAADLSLPKIMVPTTAGTGSEVTHESVLKVDGKKKAFVEAGLTTDVAIVDPDLCRTMSKRLTASSGMDALAHAVECSESRRSNPIAKTLALEAYNLVKDNLMQAVKGDTQAMVNLSLGSLMAGMAFGNSGTTLGHALSYPLSNRGIPHGEAVAMVLPYALEFNGSDLAFARKLRKFVRIIEFRWEPRWDAHEMAAEVMEDKRHLGNNPVEVTFEDVLGIFEKMKNESHRR